MMLERILILLCFIVFWGCSSEENSSEVNSSQSANIADSVETVIRVGFAHIVSTGKQVVLGTNLQSAKANEQSQLTVAFDYDFDLAQGMVTCGEYNVTMKTNLACEEDSLPVTNVNFYDAILYANEKSKSENLDTSYSYTQVTFDETHHCSGMEGFAFHPESEGYRLPTEAEWVLAASPKWMPDSGWNSLNSEYRLHKVCSAEKDSSKNFICDMSGNAKEWVNDWMGTFRDTVITDFVGAPDGGNIEERVVKGGSFRNTPSAITLYGRNDVYTVTSLSKADYIGFRLAIGKIPNAIWMSKGKVSTAALAKLLISSETLEALTLSSRNKLVFRNGGFKSSMQHKP